MKAQICKVCGHVALDVVPENCPVCHAAKEAFNEGDVKTSQDEGSTEKHVPVLTVVKTCGLMGDGCTDVHVRVGDTPHPMEAEHFIQWVDIYVDKKFIARESLTPECNPAAAFHIKAASGKVTAIEFCNLHGTWINEADL